MYSFISSAMILLAESVKKYRTLSNSAIGTITSVKLDFSNYYQELAPVVAERFFDAADKIKSTAISCSKMQIKAKARKAGAYVFSTLAAIILAVAPATAFILIAHAAEAEGYISEAAIAHSTADYVLGAQDSLPYSIQFSEDAPADISAPSSEPLLEFSLHYEFTSALDLEMSPGTIFLLNEEFNQQITIVSCELVVDPTASTGTFIWPADGVITSPFGPRNISIGSRYHKGVDIPGPQGSSIYAADGGEVIESRWSDSYGLFIRIRHDNGIVTLYSHNIENLVSVGERVSQGQVIALMGRTGIATGVHLHFEVIVDGVNVNPQLHLPDR